MIAGSAGADDAGGVPRQTSEVRVAARSARRRPAPPSSLIASKYQLSFQSSSGPGVVRALIGGLGSKRASPAASGSGRSSAAFRSIALLRERGRTTAMNMSSPRSVRSTTIAGAIVVIRSRKHWRRYSSQHCSHAKPGDAQREELVVVGAQERLLVRAAVLDAQGAADEVRGVPHHRAEPTVCQSTTVQAPVVGTACCRAGSRRGRGRAGAADPRPRRPRMRRSARRPRRARGRSGRR